MKNRQEIIDMFNEYRNDENSFFIDGIILKVKNRNVTDEFLNKILQDEKIVNEAGKINKYMLERYIVHGVNSERKIALYESENGKGASKFSFQHQNGIILLEKTLKGLPIEMHIKSPLPDNLKNSERTRLTVTGNRLLSLAFCDALLKIRKQWIESPNSLQESNELRLVSFIINKKTAEFLNKIGFNAQTVRLEKTNYMEGPTIKKRDDLSDKEYEEINERLKPYLYRYSVHKDANGNITPTSQLGIATISKESLISDEVVKKILKKREEIIEKLKSEDIDIKKIDDELIKQIPKFQNLDSIHKNIAINDEDFKACYGFNNRKENQKDYLSSDTIKKIAQQSETQMCKEEAKKGIDFLCNSRDIKVKTHSEN